MGQLIDFNGKITKREKATLQSTDIVGLLPHLRALKGEVIVVTIQDKVIQNDILLTNLLKEVITLKCMGAITIIVPDTNTQVSDYFNANTNIQNPFDINNFIETHEHKEIIDVLIKREIVSKIINIAKSFNTKPLGISGCDLDIILPDSIVNKNISPFNQPQKSLYGWNGNKNKKKYSIDMIDVLNKT